MALVFDFTPSNQIASFRVADEVSSYDRTRRVLNRLISSIVSFAEDLHIAVVRLTIVELRNGGLFVSKAVPTALVPSSFLTVVANAHILIAVINKQCGGATVLLHHSIDQLS